MRVWVEPGLNQHLGGIPTVFRPLATMTAPTPPPRLALEITTIAPRQPRTQACRPAPRAPFPFGLVELFPSVTTLTEAAAASGCHPCPPLLAWADPARRQCRRADADLQGPGNREKLWAWAKDTDATLWCAWLPAPDAPADVVASALGPAATWQRNQS